VSLRGFFGPFNLLGTLVAAALAILALVPLAAVLGRVFMVDGRLTLTGALDTFAIPGLGQTLANTALVTAASSVIAMLVGSCLAWLNERTDARMGLLTDFLPLVVFVLPPIAGAVGWVLLLSPRAGYLNVVLRDFLGFAGVRLTEGPFDIYSWGGLIFVYSIYQVPFSFMFVSAALRNMDSSLEEASRVSGRSLAGTFWRITLPALAPALAGALLLTVWTCLGLYSIPSVLATGAGIRVLTVEIVNAVAFSYPSRTDVAVGLSLVMVVAVSFMWALHNRVLRGSRHATVGGKARTATPIRLGRWRWPLRILVVLYAVVTTVFPVLALSVVTLSGYWTPRVNWGSLSLEPFLRQILGDPTSREALGNSLSLGASGATVAIVAAAILALFYLKVPRRWGKAIDGAIKLPSTLSPIVLAVGFVFVLAGPPLSLSGTWVILLLGYVALYFPQGSVAAEGAASQVAPELAEASAVSGANQSRTFARIYLPLMGPGLIAGWALLFVRMVGDLSASAMLAGPGNPVVGRQILDVFQNGSFSLMAAIAMTLTVISAAAVIVLTALSRRVTRWSTAATRHSPRKVQP
jgi:iron(III) transport system permease protein